MDSESKTELSYDDKCILSCAIVNQLCNDELGGWEAYEDAEKKWNEHNKDSRWNMRLHFFVSGSGIKDNMFIDITCSDDMAMSYSNNVDGRVEFINKVLSDSYCTTSFPRLPAGAVDTVVIIGCRTDPITGAIAKPEIFYTFDDNTGRRNVGFSLEKVTFHQSP